MVESISHNICNELLLQNNLDLTGSIIILHLNRQPPRPTLLRHMGDLSIEDHDAVPPLLIILQV